DVDHELHLTDALRDSERGEPLDQDPEEPGLQTYRSSFRTALQPRGPRVVWSVPLPGEPHHPVWVRPEIEFDRPVDPATVTFDRGLFLRILLFGNEFNVSGAWQPSQDSTRFTFTSGIPLERDGSYRLLAVGGPAGVRDADGVPLDQDPFTPGYQSFDALFRAEQNVRVSSTIPADGAVDVSWETEIEVRFSMPVRPESVVDTTLFLRRGETTVPAERTVRPDSLSAVLAPLGPLASYTEYEVVIGTGIRSRRGGPFDQNWSLAGHQDHAVGFRTLPETEAPRVVSVEPVDGADQVVLDAVVRIVFSEPVRPIRVLEYTYVTEGDSLGARVPGELVVSSDSLTATFTPDEDLETITTYHVHVDTWVTDPFGNRLDQDPDEPGWQKHHSEFTTRNERTPPAVEEIDPVDGATGVTIAPVVRIEFSESMDRETLPGAIRVESSGAVVEGALAYEDADRTVRWSPSGTLAYERTYRVFVDTLATDLAGNLLDQYPGTPRRDAVESFFTTETDTLPPRLVSVEPGDGAQAVAVEIVPTLTFSEPIDPSKVTAASIALNDSTGLSVASERELAADGTVVRIVPDEQLEFDSLYRILVTTALTDTNGIPFDADSLLDGNQSYASSFRTQQETIGPQVVALLLDGEPEPPVDTRIRLVFDEPVREETVGPETFRLLRDEEDVPGDRSVSASGDTATFVPDDPLAYATEHRVLVSGIEDLIGNPLDQDPQEPGDQPYEETFTTGPDRDPPRVVRSEPADGTLGVDPDAVLRLVFGEPMDTTTFSSADPGLFRDGSWVPATRTAEPGDSSFVFVPDSSLRRGAVYEWRAGTLLEDRAGNALDQDPDEPGVQEFHAFFEVGDRPDADAGPGVCSVGADPEIWVDGRGSSDPDGELAWAVWSWGDGTVDSLVAPEGLLAVHSFPCVDGAGCDEVDNDGDGAIDEQGDGGCDESYRIVLQVVDSDGFVAADTTGVSFCAFTVRGSDPTDGAAGVDTLATPALRLTRAVDPESVDSTAVWLTLESAPQEPWPDSLSVEEDGLRVVLHPRVPLLPDTTYVLRADASLRAAAGDSLDQAPCDPGIQGFEARFRTAAPADPVPPRYALPHDRRRSEER
ncbi:MAG: hypothetical protein GF346_11670, partial [Candidatus Eisenbacteria bacterium]|nr:hypothetical protein [Candidatus Latescibacterota bacterium]MBD3303095.1 hypothetical protein [Candidatus Eisenbacteria bacterium]